jgi:GNAT superfamily N-acetyltransferase
MLTTDDVGQVFMTAPISLRLDADVRATLEVEAKAQGIGLATLLRHLAADAAREVRRKRIRDASAAVAQHIAASPEARAFVESWGTPDWSGL